jgi:Rod binding domain-containing protein
MRLDGALGQIVATTRATGELQKMRKSAEELEASFVKQLLASMRKAVPESPMGQQYGGTMLRDMFDEAIASSLSGHVGLGIADGVMRHSAPEIIRQELAEMAREARPRSVDSPNSNPSPNPETEG